MKSGNFIFASAFRNGGVSDNWNGSLPERHSSASPCLLQNSHHRCENFTPKPHLSLRTAIWSSLSIFPRAIPKPICTMVSSQSDFLILGPPEASADPLD